jgi:hypothetical protein
MKRENPGFVRLTGTNCPKEFPEQLKKNNHTGDEIWFKERNDAEKDEAFVRHFSDTITLDPGARRFHTGVTPTHIIICSPRLDEEIKAWNDQISFLQTERDNMINEKDTVITSSFYVASLEYQFAHDKEKFEELEEARENHTALLKKELDASQEASALDARITVIYKRIERRVDRCHKHVNWFLSKFKYVLFPSFRADQDMLSRKKKDPLPKSCKSTLTWMAHGRQRKSLCHMMTLNGGCLIDPSESCSTIVGACCGTMCSPGKALLHSNTQGKSEVHHCPNKECRAKLVRDESGWAIFVFAVTRILLFLKEKKEKLDETYLNRRNDSTQPLAKGLAQGDFIPNYSE